MNILHLSDIHFRTNYEKPENDYQAMLTKMRNPLLPVVTCIQSLKKQTSIDLLLISGDLTEDGEVEDYMFLKQFLLKQLENVEILVTLGNHDIKSNFRQGWLEQVPSEKPYNFVSTFSDFYLVSFDSAIYGQSDGWLSKFQLDWLVQTLMKLNDKPVLLMTHHHLFDYQNTTLPLPQAAQLMKIIKHSTVTAVFNGHTHHPFICSMGTSPCYTAASMSFIGIDTQDGQIRFEECWGYNLYQIEDGRLKSQKIAHFQDGKLLKIMPSF